MNKVYLILGATSDIGMELIKKINSKEENVVLYAHYFGNTDKLLSIKMINNNKIIPIKADLTSQSDINNVIELIQNDGIVPNVIVHFPSSKLEFIKLKDIDWDKCIKEVNIQVGSLLRVLQAFLPKMAKMQTQSKIVIMLTENTIKEPAKYSTPYTMAKYMLLGLMKSLNQEYNSKKNININGLSPAMVNTKLLSDIDPRLLEMNDMKSKMLSADIVADKIMYLLSSESDELYGQNVYLPGEE